MREGIKDYNLLKLTFACNFKACQFYISGIQANFILEEILEINK